MTGISRLLSFILLRNSAGDDKHARHVIDFAFLQISPFKAQAAQAQYVWVRASEVVWSEYIRIISVLSDAK